VPDLTAEDQDCFDSPEPFGGSKAVRARRRCMEPVLVDDDEAGRLPGISRSTFHALVANGLIRRLKLGRSARYRLADLLALTDRLGVKAAGGATTASEIPPGCTAIARRSLVGPRPTCCREDPMM
jgi:hypothetical protein